MIVNGKVVKGNYKVKEEDEIIVIIFELEELDI